MLPYLDIPFQHGSPTVLKRMRRPGAGREHARAHPCVARGSVRISPSAARSSSASRARPRPSSKSCSPGSTRRSSIASALQVLAGGRRRGERRSPPHVPPEMQDERYARFMEQAAAISRSELAAKVGRKMRVLVDAIDGNTAIARSEGDAPEIDGMVRIAKGGKLNGRRIRRCRDHRIRRSRSREQRWPK